MCVCVFGYKYECSVLFLFSFFDRDFFYLGSCGDAVFAVENESVDVEVSDFFYLGDIAARNVQTGSPGNKLSKIRL